jgi:hypothetical protein
MSEPKRNGSWEELAEPFKTKVHLLFEAMRARGFDPVIFEGCRTFERQKWLYAIGRTRSLKRKTVTWTLTSKHLKCQAVDVISKKSWWNNPKFYVALRQEAEKLGLYTIYKKEADHVQLAKVINGSYSV